MNIGISIWAFLAFISCILIWNFAFKRKISEAMMLGVLVVNAFGGLENYFPNLIGALLSASESSSAMSPILFIMMAALMTKTGVIYRLVNILNSLLGRLRGGAAYVSVAGSAVFGPIAGSSAVTSATVGSITIPWMQQTGWSPEMAATINAGNSGLCLSIPLASSSLYMLLGFAEVTALVSTDSALAACWCAGMWTLLWRFIMVRYYVGKYNIQKVDRSDIEPLKRSLRLNGKSLTICLGIAIPFLLTVGPLSQWLRSTRFGPEGVEAIDIIVWIPIAIMLITLLEGRKFLPKGKKEWADFFKDTAKSQSGVAPMVLFSITAGELIKNLGFSQDMTALLSALNMPNAIMIIAIGLVVVLMASPLNAMATTTAIGSLAFLAMTNSGVAPAAAIAAFMVYLSTEGTSPPTSTAIFISCGLAECKVESTFKNLILHYCIPLAIIGMLIALGILPVIS